MPEPIALTLDAKIFIQFAGGELIEVSKVQLPLVVGVFEQKHPVEPGDNQ